MTSSFQSPTKCRAERRLYIFPAALAFLLICTDRWFNAVDDEYTILDHAAKSVSETLNLFLKGVGEHEHPPLYDILLHGWLRLTGGNEHLLRIPSILFYSLGAWVIAAVARRLGGVQSQVSVLILITISPFGFHFGRLATWYSFCFLLVSCVSFAYFRYLDRPSSANWVFFAVSSLALVYSNYFGWALLSCLAVDYWIRSHMELRRSLRVLLATGFALLLAYVPLMRPFWRELHSGTHLHRIGLATVANGIYGVYCLFVSESVAPWFWFLGIPGAIAIAVCLFVTVLWTPPPARRFALYFLALFLLMTFLGIAIPKRLLFVSPWLVLPIGMALSRDSSRIVRGALIIGLTVITGIGWYGIFSRRYYAAPHWVEPWKTVAQSAAEVVRSHGIVIGDNPSFFFYLSYLLPKTSSLAYRVGSFGGYLPVSVQTSGVYDAPHWFDAGRPVSSTVVLVKGVHYGMPSMEDPEHWLNDRCRVIELARMVRDPGFLWKRRFAPDIDQPEWRIEVRTYACAVRR